MNDLHEEALLISRCRAGDSGAWDLLFEAHYSSAFQYIFQLSHDFSREDVEEICQETFLSVIRNIQSFKGDSQFRTWLFRIAGNRARDFLERRSALKRGGKEGSYSLEALHPETGLKIDPPTEQPGPDECVLRAEQNSLLMVALERLGDSCREIIQLRYFGDLSYEEIASSLGTNSKTVSSRLSRCLAQLEEIARKIFSEGKRSSMPSNEYGA